MKGMQYMRGKKPSLKQKKQLKYMGLDPNNWFVQQDTPDYMRIVHRLSGKERKFSKQMLVGMNKKN